MNGRPIFFWIWQYINGHETFNGLAKVAAETQQEREYIRRYLSQASLIFRRG